MGAQTLSFLSFGVLAIVLVVVLVAVLYARRRLSSMHDDPVPGAAPVSSASRTVAVADVPLEENPLHGRAPGDESAINMQRLAFATARERDAMTVMQSSLSIVSVQQHLQQGEQQPDQPGGPGASATVSPTGREGSSSPRTLQPSQSAKSVLNLLVSELTTSASRVSLPAAGAPVDTNVDEEASAAPCSAVPGAGSDLTVCGATG